MFYHYLMSAHFLFQVPWVVINEESVLKVKFKVFSFALSECFCQLIAQIAVRVHF